MHEYLCAFRFHKSDLEIFVFLGTKKTDLTDEQIFSERVELGNSLTSYKMTLCESFWHHKNRCESSADGACLSCELVWLDDPVSVLMVRRYQKAARGLPFPLS